MFTPGANTSIQGAVPSPPAPRGLKSAATSPSSAPTASTLSSAAGNSAPGPGSPAAVRCSSVTCGEPWLPAAATITVVGVSRATARSRTSGGLPSAVETPTDRLITATPASW